MDKSKPLYDQIELLRKEISDSIDESFTSISDEDIIHKSNKLNQLIVEYQKLLNKK